MTETYQLKHTGEQIDALLDKAGTAVQPTDIPADIATQRELSELAQTTDERLSDLAQATDAKLTELSAEIDAVDASVQEQGKEVKKLQYTTITNEKGLFITDEKGNIGWAIQPIITEDSGVAFVDKDGNIGIMMKDGKIDICKAGDNLVSSWANDDVKLASVTNQMYAELKQMRE